MPPPKRAVIPAKRAADIEGTCMSVTNPNTGERVYVKMDDFLLSKTQPRMRGEPPSLSNMILGKPDPRYCFGTTVVHRMHTKMHASSERFPLNYPHPDSSYVYTLKQQQQQQHLLHCSTFTSLVLATSKYQITSAACWKMLNFKVFQALTIRSHPHRIIVIWALIELFWGSW